MGEILKINIIGSGNVATHLIREFLKHPEISLQQIYARKLENLKEFEGSAVLINDINLLVPADITILSISDDALEDFSRKLKNYQSLVVHTSGSKDLHTLHTPHKGVFYPFQSFSKEKKNIYFENIPLLIEATNNKDLVSLRKLAKILSNKVFEMNSQQRLALHTAGVFAANFVNYMYLQAEKILHQNNIPYELIKPLILEVAQKATKISPREAQTGPAIRKDMKVIEKHLDILQGDTKNLYKSITEQILKDFKK